MPSRRFRAITSTALVAFAAGCGGGGSSSTLGSAMQLPPTPPGPLSTVVIIIKSSPTAATRRPLYVSPGTKSLKVTVTPSGGASNSVTADCATSCQATIQAPAGVDKFAIALYDASGATGNILSSGTTTATISAGQTNSVNISFGGSIAKLGITADASSLRSGVAGSIPLNITGYDADGYAIVGSTPYSVPISLSLADSLGATSLSTASMNAPGQTPTLSYNGAQAGANATVTVSTTGTNSAGGSFPVSASAPAVVKGGAPGRAPLHVPNYAYYEGFNLNQRINATWFAQHFTMTQQGSDASYAAAFLAAGGKYALQYTDPNLVPGCTWPAPYRCTGVMGNVLPNESSWLHDSTGARLHVISNGTQRQGNWQERLNPGDPAVQAAFASVTANLGGNAIFADDGAASADPTPPNTNDYDLYKYGALPREYCGGTAVECEGPSAKFLADYGALLNRSAHPVLINSGTLDAPDNLAQMRQNPNLLGNSLENCDRPGVSDASWQYQQNYILQVVALHRYAVCFTKLYTNSPAARGYALASFWTVYDGTYAAIWEGFSMSSGDEGIMPEYSVVPGGATVNPSSITDLQKAPGVYVREFTACAQDGSIFGKCAAIVNNTASTVSRPALSATYSETMTFNSTTSWYDGGTVQWSAGAPTTIPAYSGLILR